MFLPWVPLCNEKATEHCQKVNPTFVWGAMVLFDSFAHTAEGANDSRDYLVNVQRRGQPRHSGERANKAGSWGRERRRRKPECGAAMEVEGANSLRFELPTCSCTLRMRCCDSNHAQVGRT